MKSGLEAAFSGATQMPSTDELEHEIKTTKNIEDYLEKNKEYMLSHDLSAHLEILLKEKGLTRADVARHSGLNRTYIYQIFSGEKAPSRDKLIAIAFGLRLSYEETQKMLKISGNRSLYAKDGRDAVIIYALSHKKTIFDVNEVLFNHNMKVLDTSKI